MDTTHQLTGAALVYKAADPDDFPMVRELLHRSGIGDISNAVQLGGRNTNWLATGSSGGPVFVKYEAAAGPARTKIFHELLRSSPLYDRISTPGLRAVSADGSVQVYDVIPQSVTAQQRIIEASSSTGMFHRMGAAVGALHSLGAAGTSGVPPVDPMPSSFGVEAVAEAVLPALSAAQLSAFRLVHTDAEVYRAALDLLAGQESAAPLGTVHGDLRLDQVLVEPDGACWLIDWEEFGIGRLSRDLGSLIGDVINTSVIAALCDRDAAAPARRSDRIRTGLEQAKDRTAALCAGYRESCGSVWGRDGFTGEVLGEIARYAGWHQFDRLLTTAEGMLFLTPASRALAGIGRALLTDPAIFVDEFELGEVLS
ncbi:phosphotransferase [Nocardia sp. NPDC003963]